MIDRGANPFVVTFGGETWTDKTRNLSNLPCQSVYFTIRSPSDESEEQKFPDPWFYKTGIFNGNFDSVIGQGATSTVISGKWFGKESAFKFVEIGTQKFDVYAEDALKKLDEKLSEMIEIQSTVGSKIVSFYGHYRLAY